MEQQLIQILRAALSLLAILDSSLAAAAAAATLSPGETLSDGQLLVSPAKIFELGFFSPANFTAKYLGIWYRATPDVVVWVANRQNPITTAGALTLSRSGNLILTSEKGEIAWSSNSSSTAAATASTPILRLLDSGNLVVAAAESAAAEIWMSFDYPCDTRLSEMIMADDPDAGLDKHLTSWKSSDDPSPGDFVYRIENHGLPQMTIFNGSRKIYRSGPWNGRRFAGFPIAPYPILEPFPVFRDGRLVSLSHPKNTSAYMRVTMNYTGFLQRYIVNAKGDGWALMFTEPTDACDSYSVCGANTVCKFYQTPMCECLRGFTRLKSDERGCSRVPPSDCAKEDGFVKVDRVKLPDTLSFRINHSMGADDCREECLRNCSCSAYAAPYFNNESNGCLMWFGDLFDVKEHIGDVKLGPSLYIRVPVAELDSGKRKRRGRVELVRVAMAASFGVLALILCLGGITVTIRRMRRVACDKESEDLELPLFGLKAIAAATNDFSYKNLIGEGGFGPVYKGNLSAGVAIAVKRMSKTSGQGPKEFKNEVILIAKLQHRNLVRILGCCIEGEEKMLIYEYMHNQSLDYFIFDQDRRSLLTWQKRFDIIMGIARGLLYLHHDSRLKIIHRDLKASNILLDENLNAKISDFGLARMFEGDQTIARTKRVVGTFGYMAPEYAFDGKFSVKSDVFSLGVVILEIVSGKKNRGFKQSSCYQNLLEQAWLLWEENRELELIDECYNSTYVEWQVKRCIQVGLLCVQNAAEERPAMPSVVLMLSSEDTVLARPGTPAFFLNTSPSFLERNTLRSGSLTITELEGR